MEYDKMFFYSYFKTISPNFLSYEGFESYPISPKYSSKKRMSYEEYPL